MTEKKAGCTVPSAKVAKSDSEKLPVQTDIVKEEKGMTVMVGKKAPDFTAPAFHKGEFKTVTLSDYLGKWVALCFYPGDFTFV